LALLPKAVPMRWASGPLEIALRGKTDGFTPQHKQTLERFHDPGSLDILKDSPIDCLVLSWAAGLPVPGAPANMNPARVLNMSFGGYACDGAGANCVCDFASQSAIDDANKAVSKADARPGHR